MTRWIKKEVDYPSNYRNTHKYELWEDDTLYGTIHPSNWAGESWYALDELGSWHFDLEKGDSLSKAKARLVESAYGEQGIATRARRDAIRRGEELPRLDAELNLWPDDKVYWIVEFRYNPVPVTRRFMTYQEAKENFIEMLSQYGCGCSLRRRYKVHAYQYDRLVAYGEGQPWEDGHEMQIVLDSEPRFYDYYAWREQAAVNGRIDVLHREFILPKEVVAKWETLYR